MEKWESGTADGEGENTWVIIPDKGGPNVNFIPTDHPKIKILRGAAVKFTRNPNNPGWAAEIVLDTGLAPLTTAAEDGAKFTPAARARLDSAVAERLFWASFLPEAEQAGATDELHKRLQALKGPVKKQTLIDEGF